MFVHLGKRYAEARALLRLNTFGRSAFATVRPPDPRITAVWRAAQERIDSKRTPKREPKAHRTARRTDRLKKRNQRARHERARKELDKCQLT